LVKRVARLFAEEWTPLMSLSARKYESPLEAGAFPAPAIERDAACLEVEEQPVLPAAMPRIPCDN